jgi:hypothetical protein
MLIDLAVHWGIDMTGAASLACIYGACKNPTHNHPAWLTWIANNPWKVQSVIALGVAFITLRLVG